VRSVVGQWAGKQSDKMFLLLFVHKKKILLFGYAQGGAIVKLPFTRTSRPLPSHSSGTNLVMLGTRV